MIVDDDPHVIRVLSLGLTNAGYEVVSANNGAVALELIANATPDALITDIRMPRLDGRGLCEKIEAAHPDREFLILIMTSLTAFDERQWVAKMRNTEFLEKPLSTRQLLGRLAAFFGT